MYNLLNLKPKITVTETTVECPVESCNHIVERQRDKFLRLDKFKCPIHNIYISPSTFEYEKEADNLLWTDPNDLALFNRIKNVKRESRISRDNSEDAVTWNVFRYLERNHLLESLLYHISGEIHSECELILWSYSEIENMQHQSKYSGWSFLNVARRQFGEIVKRDSEPDIIILSDKTLFFIEAKVQAHNNTIPSNSSNPKMYLSGGKNWFREVFKTTYQSVAIDERKYELTRFWLLGTWIAKEMGRKFQLVNLVLSGKERKIEADFGKHIMSDSNNRFSRFTWEEIYTLIGETKLANNETHIILDYFNYKTTGYRSNGLVKKTFTI